MATTAHARQNQLVSENSVPLGSPLMKKGGPGDASQQAEQGMPLRPTLSFRSKPVKPEVPTLPATSGGFKFPPVQPQGADDSDSPQGLLKPTTSFRSKPVKPEPPPRLRSGHSMGSIDVKIEGAETLRPTLSFRSKPVRPEPPARIQAGHSFESMEIPSENGQRQGITFGAMPIKTDIESEHQRKTKSKIEILSSLLRNEAVPNAPVDFSSDEDNDEDDTNDINVDVQGKKPVPIRSGRAILHPGSRPPPLPPSGINLGPLPPATLGPKVVFNPGPSAAPTTTEGLPRTKSRGSLGKQFHSRVVSSQRKSQHEEMDVFGRCQSEMSGGSNTSKGSLRSTLSRALGLGSSKKSDALAVAKTDNRKASSFDSQIQADYEATSNRGKHAKPPPVPKRGKERPIKDKHVEVIAEVHTKSGRHTMVRSKKPKKKETHALVSGEAPAAPSSTPSQMISMNPNFQSHPQQLSPAHNMYMHQRVPMMPHQQTSFERYAQTIFDFFPHDPINSKEMVIRRGDVLVIYEQGDDGWCEGVHTTTGARGLFPVTHVQFLN